MASNRERQAAELTLLSTMYPTEFSWRSDPPPDLTQPSFAHDPSFALTLHPSFTLELALPEAYPDSAKPTAYLSCGGHVGTQCRKDARAALAAVVAEQDPGVEILDLIVTAFADLLPSFAETDSAGVAAPTPSAPGAATGASSPPPPPPPTITRLVIWSHHLLATSKRRDIQAWSRELNLGGFARPGHPGSVFVEGVDHQVHEFVRRLKQLRWQALQVRGEETASERICAADGVVEVEGLGEIAERLKERDPESATLFLQAMKIAKTE